MAKVMKKEYIVKYRGVLKKYKGGKMIRKSGILKYKTKDKISNHVLKKIIINNFI